MREAGRALLPAREVFYEGGGIETCDFAGVLPGIPATPVDEDHHGERAAGNAENVG